MLDCAVCWLNASTLSALVQQQPGRYEATPPTDEQSSSHSICAPPQPAPHVTTAYQQHHRNPTLPLNSRYHSPTPPLPSTVSHTFSDLSSLLVKVSTSSHHTQMQCSETFACACVHLVLRSPHSHYPRLASSQIVSASTQSDPVMPLLDSPQSLVVIGPHRSRRYLPVSALTARYCLSPAQSADRLRVL